VVKLIAQLRSGILIVACGVAACVGAADDGNGAAGTTVFSQRGDTVVATTAGRMPDSLVHHLVEELRVGVANGADDEMFGRIDELAVSPDGHMLVVDGSVPAVRLYDSTGALVRQVGRKGGGPGEYGNINGIAVLPGGGWAIWDASGSRINTYSADGAFLASARSPVTGYGSNEALRSDRARNLYLEAPLSPPSPDGQWRTGLVRLDSTLATTDTLTPPTWGAETVRLVAIAEGGSSSYTLPFWPQDHFELNHSGKFVSGKGYPYEIHSFTASGAPLIIERNIPRIDVRDEVREEQREFTTWMLRRTAPDWKWNGPEIPHYKPAFVGLLLGGHDRIWVRLSTEFEPIPEDELTVSNRPNPRPTIHWRDAPPRFDVFEPDGTYLGEVAVPRNVSVMKTDGDLVWGVTIDDDGVQYLTRFRVEPPLGG
jgi:hypothetical protein